MIEAKNTSEVSAATNVVDDAVGVAEGCWFVAIVNHNAEKKAAEKLEKLNIRYYLPIQTEYRVWKNGRKAKVDRVVIPSTIFIYCSEQKRREIVCLPVINRFMVNKAGSKANSNQKPLAVIPEEQIKTLQFMLENSDTPVTITDRPFEKGDLVRVIRGTLAGLQGEIRELNSNRSELIVTLDFFGCAKLKIDTINVEKIK